MQTVMDAPVAAERRSAERINLYIRFDYRCKAAGDTPVEGRGVTINLSTRGALLLMPSGSIAVGAPIELVFHWGEGSPCAFAGAVFSETEGGRDGAGFSGPSFGPPRGERLVRTQAVVVRVQPLDGFPSSATLRSGVSVGFVAPLV